MGKKKITKRILPMALAAAMVITSVPVMAAPNDLSGHWAEKVMTEWQEKGLIKGYEDGSVKPDNAVSRAEFVIMMNNALGLKGAGKVSFSDVKEGDWYYNAVATAVEAGYCKGYDDGTFKPGATITRAEAAIMIANAAGLKANTAATETFKDAATIPAWAKGSVGAVVEAGFMSGYPDGTFGATASIKRAEAVSSLNRVMGNKADTPVVPEEEEKTETDNKKGSGGGGSGSSSGGGSGSGGGSTTPTVPTVTKTVKTSEELDAAIDADAANKNVVINVDANAMLTENVDAIFNGKELTINFNNVDMTDDLEIIAHNATKIYLNDKTTGEGGTEVVILTIDAPNAEVVSNIVADTVDIIAVKDGTFHARDKVKDKIEIKKGAVEVAAAVADTTKVTVPKEATDDVKIKGEVKEVNIETTQKVVLDAEVMTANVTAENASVTVSKDAAVATVNVDAAATGATVTGEGSIETANVSAEATLDTAAVTTLEVTASVKVTVGENATVGTVEVSADAAEISGAGAIEKIEAAEDVIVSATNVTEVEVGSGVTAELKSDVANVTVPATATEAPTIKVEEGVKVDTVTTEANVNVTGSGSITNVTVNSSGNEKVTITAPEDSAIEVESVVNTGSGNVEINNESKNDAKLPENTSKAVTDTVETVNIDLSASDEWRTDGYLYELFDIGFDGAEWVVEEFDWNEVTFWIDGEQFIWDPETSKPGEYAVETDFMDYSYDAETGTAEATGLVAAYVDNVAAGESYEAEIKFPSSYLEVADNYAINSGRTFTVSFDIDITDSGTKLTPAKDTLKEITINVAEADDWQTEGYVYVEKEITFDAARWTMEPYWEEHVTYWIDGEQFQWIPGESVVGDYDVEVEMVPEYDEAGNLSMKAMVFAYVENVENNDTFKVEIKVPTYSLERTDDNHRITRNETAVIDFTVNIEGCEGYVAPVVDTVDDIYIDLSASDEWRTEGYLYQMFDITFNAAEFAVEELDWENITYWVNGEQFIWDVETSKPGDFAVEADIFSYGYDEESRIGYAPGLIAAFVDNVAVDEVYEVEIHFPSNHLRITEEGYEFKNGETFVVDFNVHIVDSEEELPPAKDKLEEITIDLETADEWQTDGYVYVEKEITFDAAKWIREPYWDAQHVTYWIDGEQFQWIPGESVVGAYDVEVDMAPDYDDEGNLTMKAMVFAYVDNVEDGDSYNMEIRVPTYCLERTDDAHRITRDTAVIDFKVNITDSASDQPSIPEDAFSAEVTDTVIDCYVDNDDAIVTKGTVTVEFTFENYAEAVTFGMMEHCDDEDVVAVEAEFEGTDEDTGFVTFDMTGAAAAEYEVVYLVGDTWYGTGEYIDLSVKDQPSIPKDAFSAEVTGTKVDCYDNGTTVENGTITVEFTFENYADAVVFGLMDHDNGENVTVDAEFEGTDEETGSVTFDMADVPVAVYEVVYYLADVDTWVGTGTYIDLTEKDESEVEVNFTLNEDFTATWNGVEGYSGYRIDIGDNSIWVMDGITEANNLLSFIPCADEGTTYDIVLKGLDADYKATELARLEDALEVTVSGEAAIYEAVFDENSITVAWEAEGVGEIHEVRNSDGTLLSVGGGSVTPTQTINYNNNYTVANGDVLDMRVVTNASLDGQVLRVTITPASKTTYEVTE